MLHATPFEHSLALEGCEQHAGHALACAFSSSDEYEAALIAQRRAEGRYGSRWRRRRGLIACVAIAAALSCILLALA